MDGARPRKDFFLNPILIAAILLVAEVRHRNHLQHHQSFGPQQALQGGKISWQIFVADGFQHFAGNDPVKTPRQLAIIAELNVDAFWTARLAQQPGGPIATAARKENTGDAAAE